ncbi:hypothetical protein B0H16DRAFT_1524322 [Mycena metata]|uniref:CipC-like antibiotic response protein n=1 Tax=Mycena metata TaxID=1033252 RepID=A0AAD7JIU3_9AGAR|nr:hypothetical protein B0H16DRAFT_1524322 [Mycena metata]
MGLFDDDDDYRRHEEAWRTVEEARLHPEHHKAKLSHELIAGAASFAAAKMYEHRLEKEGKPVDHAGAKALLAGFAGAYIDRLAETKGADAWEGHKNKEELKEHAARQLERDYTEQAHQRWNAEHDHWHANGGPQAYVPPPAGYDVGYMPYYPAQGGGYPPQGSGYQPPMYAPPPMGYAPPPMGYAPPPMGYAPPPMGYAPPPVGYAGESERPHHHHHGLLGGLAERREEAFEERREEMAERREEVFERRGGFGFGRGRHERHERWGR